MSGYSSLPTVVALQESVALHGICQGGHHFYSCLRRYGDSRYFSNPKGATAALKAYLEGFFKGYGRPVWLTEWALADFGGASNNWAWTFPTYAQQVGDLLILKGDC